MNFCNNCGEKITTEGTIYCPICGNKVDLDTGVINSNHVDKGESFKDGREYIKLQYEKISFEKSKLKIIKTFIQENLVLIFCLNFIAYLLLTIAPAAIGWIYIICLMLWGYLFPLLTESNQMKFNQTIENNLLNSDIIIKDYFEKQKRAKIEREEEMTKDRQREYEIQLEKELEMRAEEAAKQQELVTDENVKYESSSAASTSVDITFGGESITKKKSHINTIILFLGMLPILVVVSIILSSDYFFIDVTGSLLLPTLIISFLSSMIYYIPTFISRGPGKTIIFIINLLFGWSIIGWIICLVWAMNDNSKWDIMQVMQQNNKINIQSSTKPVE